MARAPRLPQGGPAFVDEPAEASRAARLIVEADGGSRGDPGLGGYGALVRDATSGEVLAVESRAIGACTNNVAEYAGLIAGLRLARAVDPSAAVEVRMDSRLVIEQMAGRWNVKNADLKSLADAARELVPAQVTWTWVPREHNGAADALANAAMDGNPTP